MGLQARAPEKEDFRYNFAVSGARCESLMGGERQVPQLVDLMDEEPEAWRGGVVVIPVRQAGQGSEPAGRQVAR